MGGGGHQYYKPWTVTPNQVSVFHGQSEITVCQIQSDVRICHVPSDITICHGESEIILSEMKIKKKNGCSWAATQLSSMSGVFIPLLLVEILGNA